MTVELDFAVAGLDSHACSIITQRWIAINQYLSPYFSEVPWFDALRFPSDSQQRAHIEQALAQHISAKTTEAKGEKVKAILFSLAVALGLAEIAERSQIALCLGRGWFSKRLSKNKLLERPPLETILPQLRAIRLTHTTAQKRAATLQEQQLCKDAEAAYEVAKEISDLFIEQKSVSLLIGLLCAFAGRGSIGLLSVSYHPLTEELLFLERQTSYFALPEGELQIVLEAIRHDLSALHYGLYSVHPKLWQPDMLHARPRTQRRKDYAKHLYPRVRQRVVQSIASRYDGNVETAEMVLTLFTQAGLTGIIDWRCHVTTATTQSLFEQQRALKTLVDITNGMNVWAKEECRRLVLSLIDAVASTQVQFSFQPLLTEFPSSYRRKAWGRRYWFGVPAIMRRKRVYRRSKAAKINHQQAKKQGTYTVDKEHAQELVTAFARAATLTETDARVRLRDFLTYGVLGLLPRGQWATVFDQRLVSWLQLIKLGRLDGAVPWAALLKQLNQHCSTLGISVPNEQVVRALFNSLPKPRYWHGGKGIATDGIRQRATLIQHGRPRLHASWAVISFALTLELTLAQPRQYHMLLVIDQGSNLPMGGWLSADKPDSCEIGLALYNAIWHPGIAEWPIHGIPEVIQVPLSLAGTDTQSLHQAAAFLLARLEIVQHISLEGKARIREMRSDLQTQAVHAIRSHGETASVTVGNALQQLLEWLIPRYFPEHHSASVPKAVQRHNVGIAGHDTPAAGLLLPLIGTVPGEAGGVTYEGMRFRSEHAHVVHEQQWNVRAFPVFYPKLSAAFSDSGIFVQSNQGQIHYLEPM